MAGIPPFFLSGGNAKIRVNGVTLAFVTDLTYSIRTAHQQTHVLGMYEPTSVEPLSYKVTGSFTVVRYMTNVKGELTQNGYATPSSTVNDGNGIGTWTNTGTTGVVNSLITAGTIGNDGRVYESFDPSKLQNGTFFDIEVYQKMPNTLSSRGAVNVRNCRITGADFKISKKSVALQTFTFEALYADEDSFIAQYSGTGQQFS